MKIYTTLFKKYKFTIRICTYKKDNKPTVNTHKSQSGYISLIYDPTISFKISSQLCKDDITFAIDEIDNFNDSLKKVYKTMANTEDLYVEDNHKLVMDNNKAAKIAIKLQSFNKTLIITPSIVAYNNTLYEGVAFLIDGAFAAELLHYDLKSLIKTIDKTDFQTYVMCHGVMEYNEILESKLDKAAKQMSNIEDMLNVLLDGKKVNPTLNWRSASVRDEPNSRRDMW